MSENRRSQGGDFFDTHCTVVDLLPEQTDTSAMHKRYDTTSLHVYRYSVYLTGRYLCSQPFIELERVVSVADVRRRSDEGRRRRDTRRRRAGSVERR